MDDLTQKKEEEYGVSKRRLEIPLSVKVLRTFSFFVFILLLVLFGRTLQLQIVEGEEYSDLARRNIVSVSREQMKRGVIYDRNKEQLVYNLPRYDLRFKGDKSSLKKESLDIVSGVVEKEKEELLASIESNKEKDFVIIKEDLDHDSLVSLRSRMEDLPGFSISGVSGRDYPFRNTLSHILGYTGEIDRDALNKNPDRYTIHDHIGKMGVEKYYERILSTGLKERITGRDDSKEESSSQEEIRNLVLTIDAELQRATHEKAKEKLEETEGSKISVVALDPDTSEVLAMTNVPSFDNNAFKGGGSGDEIEEILYGEEDLLLNEVTSATYATGSVIKPLLAVAALEEGIIEPEKEIHSPGYITVPNPWNPSEPTIFRDYQAHGWRDMREAIAVSSNVYFYAIGGGYEDQEGLGVSRIKEYLSLFGWNDRTEIDLPYESGGFIPSPEWKREALDEPWYVGDTYNLSIGQGYLSTTPLQVANSYAALANGGDLYSPRVGKKILNEEGEVVREIESQLLREDIAEPEHMEVVREGMLETTRMGTATSLGRLPVEVGAKTGTAQTSKEGVNNNWVGVFAPYEDPEIVMVALVEEVEGVTPVAAHLVRDILLEYFDEEDKNNEEEL